MAAWNHYNKWNDGFYSAYRMYVAGRAPFLWGPNAKGMDCADLSISLLVEFAAAGGLPVTFRDVDQWLYISKAMYPFGPNKQTNRAMVWSTPQVFTAIVQKKIQTKSLWTHNTVAITSGPEPGALMMRYTTVLGYAAQHHTALVFAKHEAGKHHPRENDSRVPEFPGPDVAMAQTNVYEYFVGTVREYDDTVNSWELGTTKYRHPDKEVHVDYLNSRGDAKRNAELIYYANARQLTGAGFEFRKYNNLVLDNWDDWDGKNGLPPLASRGITGW